MIVLSLLNLVFAGSVCAAMPRAMDPVDTSKMEVGGILGKALDASVNGRLKQFIKDANSEPIRLFDRTVAAKETEKNWKGEHAGKWLYAAARAAHRTGDPELIKSIKTVADYLVSQQEPDGYLGTYAPSIRMTAESDINIKSWDIWVHAYLIVGLVEVNKYFPDERYINCAKKIADLCIETFQKGGRSIAHSSYHHGMVGTGTINAAMELYLATGEEKYLDFAGYCAEQMEYRKGLELISRSLAGYDVALIGNGKNYEMIRNYVGLLKFATETTKKDYYNACLSGWDNINRYHLMPTGGPWGGVGIHLECFNVQFMFSPYGFNETCTTMAWTAFNYELLEIEGEAKYAEMLDTIAYNAIIGAQFPDGLGWCYHSHVNGKRSRTGEWACCSSSGAVALEQLPPMIYTKVKNGVAVNIYTPGKADVDISGNRQITIEQKTRYPFDGDIELTITISRPMEFSLSLRIPQWAKQSNYSINDVASSAIPAAGEYLELSRKWTNGDKVKLSLPMIPRLIYASNEYNEQGWYMDAKVDYVAMMRGPLVYAAEHVDTLEKPAPIIVPRNISVEDFKAVSAPKQLHGPAYSLTLTGEDSMVFVPFYEVAGRGNDIYRTVWLQFESE